MNKFVLRIPHFLTFFKSHILFSTFRPILVDFSIYSGVTIWVKASWNTRMHIVSQMTSCLIDFNYYSLKFKTWVGFLKFLIHNFKNIILASGPIRLSKPRRQIISDHNGSARDPIYIVVYIYSTSKRGPEITRWESKVKVTGSWRQCT